MKIKEIKIREDDGSYSDPIPVGADSLNVDYENTNVKNELDKLNSENNINKQNINNLQSNLNTTNSNLNLQTSRIDNLSTLQEGSTSGDAELIDIRISADGVTYDNAGNAVRKQLSNINLETNEITEVTNALRGFNYNKRPHTSGYYNQNGTVTNNNSCYTVAPIKFFKGDVIRLYHVYGYFCYYKYKNGSMTKLTNETWGAYDEVINATNDGVLYVTVNNNYESVASIEIDHKMPANQSDLYIKKIVTVGTGKEFQSLFAAVNQVKNKTFNKYNRCEIQMYAGTYNVWNEIGGSSYTSQIVLPDYVDIVGMENGVIIDLSIPDNAVTLANSTELSALNFNKNNNLKNVTVKAYNCRYCIHDETTDLVSNCEQTIEDCTFIHNGYKSGSSESEVWHWTSAFGAGSNTGMKYHFKNCKFYGFANPGFGMHDNANQTKDILLQMDDCEFYSTGNYSFRLSSAYDNSGKHKCILNNCKIGKKAGLTIESNTGATECTWVVVGSGNTKVPVYVPDGDLTKWLMADEVIRAYAPNGIQKGDIIKCLGGEISDISSGYKAMGVALENIQAGGYGYFKFNGYVPSSLVGLQSVEKGNTISIAANGEAVVGDDGTLGELGYTLYDDFIKLYNHYDF